MAKTKKKKPLLKKKKLAVRKKIKKSLKPKKRRKFLAKPVKYKKVVKRAKKQKVKVKNLKAKKVFKKKKPVLKSKKRDVVKKKVAIKRLVKHKSAPKIKRLKKKQAVKKFKAQQPAEGFPAESLFKAKIKVIGIGGGGGSIVSEIGRSLEKASFMIADTDFRALKKKNGIKYFWFGEEFTHGLGTGVNVELAKQAAESAKEKLSANFKDQDIIIFVASLGGGLGSGATQVFAEVAKEFGGITLGIFTMPFKFEGKNKQRVALNALKSLKQSLNVYLVIPNERIFKIIEESTPITAAFSTVNKSLIESLESLIDLIYNPGIINIDFADLRTILRGRGNSAFLNTVEESGKDRVEKTCENIFKNPLLQNSGFKAEKILFNIAGAENLSMFEVEKISSYIDRVNPNAKIIFGISKNSKLKNKIKTTILMTGGEIKEESSKIEIKKQIPIKVEKSESVEKFSGDKEIKIEKPKTRLEKKSKQKKQQKHSKKQDKKKVHPPKPKSKEEGGVSFIPVFEVPTPAVPILEQRRIDIEKFVQDSGKKTIRRSGLEIRKAEEAQEKKRQAQEKEWEIPAFLRKVKFTRPNDR